ncbi:MAG: hypothetical protein WC379_05910 [Methanoregula sp.]
MEKDCRKIPKDLLPNIFEHVENLFSKSAPARCDQTGRCGIAVPDPGRGEYRIIYRVLHESREVIVYYIRRRSVAYREV